MKEYGPKHESLRKNRKMTVSLADVFDMKVCAGEVVDGKAQGQTAL